ncbi:lysine N(6)-hydroxylase/L-ornithine N(5)-oxygenase family protein [Bradyrhizobium xenonodulans]|uniref:Lysine N(6)-hydroxylase/L-ornithine N(5)-oxygenase family protein n=1 Tax=Bradyrhizobium xenonodulans TaxID=2736875 RepID=A0ABY7MX10_9BRAD|nr:SidA/IucD/PvdA family monooxygenase [Bradyrhizobium xenonodulans]WBL82739.1 lysine N(6)-hydroxylase/L-ornithine N(5)-oxygenase family protein [Bradyrhizobium xenonodulans]
MLDVIGIGIGPFNLSLAALIEPTPLRALFLEKREGFCWHPGLALPNSRLQVSPLKDCVTLVDPTSPYSFLNYLALHGRLYSFVNRRDASTSRREFTDYYQWVARRLKTLRFGEEVVDVAPFRDGYRVNTSTTTYLARAVVIGVGVEPKIPACARPLIGNAVYHAADYLERDPPYVGEHVLVVGGGQSGAEIVEHMLSRPVAARITWVTSRTNLFAMDDNSFVNEAYMPGYSRRFHALPLQQRRAIVEHEKLTSDGISVELCNRLYDMLYQRGVEGTLDDSFRLLSGVVLTDITSHNKRWQVDLSGIAAPRNHSILVDRIVLATGFQPRTPPFLQTLLRGAHMEDSLPVVGPDYAVRFDQHMPGPVYLQNQSRLQHGLQSVNLSLVAYRSSLIINSLLGQPFYLDTSDRQILDGYDTSDMPEPGGLDAMPTTQQMAAIT